MPHCVQCRRYFQLGGHSYSRCKECRHNPSTIIVNNPTPAYAPAYAPPVTQTQTTTYVSQPPAQTFISPGMSYAAPSPMVTMSPYGAPMATTTTAYGPYGATTYMAPQAPTVVALPPQPMAMSMGYGAPSYTTTSYAPAPYY
jgi:hypothetical protein